MHSVKPMVLLLTLFLCACGGGSGGNGHADRGGSKPPAMQEFGDVVARLVRQQDNTGEPENINPTIWSYRVNENEAAFNHLF